ncbi:MAG: sugar phosphate isomerase/epimerase [Clostridiales bacterium]|nr:sugar phosphate isomerase/epimerase [Clostridiales bacterium]
MNLKTPLHKACSGIFRYMVKTLGCPDWSFDEILEAAKSLGYQGIEIRGIDGQMRADKIVPFLPGNQQDTIRKVNDYKLDICTFGSSVKFDNPLKLDEMLEEGRISIGICARMGIPFVRVFGEKIENEGNEQLVIDSIADGIETLCLYAQGTEVNVLLEVHGDFNRADRILKIANKITSPKFGVLWDIEHSDKVYGDNFKAFYEPIKNLVRHVHVKDHIRNSGEFMLCSIGAGDIPTKEIFELLERNGYKGYYSLEWEKKWHSELADPEVEFPSYVAFMNSLF